MNETLIAILVPLVTMASVFGIVYVVVTSKHKQNMAMIERGINPNENDHKKENKVRDGLFFLMVPIGLIIGYFFQIEFKMKGPFPYLIFGFLFMGLSRVIAYYIEKKKEENNTDNNLPANL
jgi:dolichol kinase